MIDLVTGNIRQPFPKKNHMGIRGLTKCITWAAPSLPQPTSLNFWRGKMVGVDIHCLLYRARAMDINILQMLTIFLLACHNNEIKILCVFDGKPPAEKTSISEQRRNAREHAQEETGKLQDALTNIVMTDEQRELIRREIRRITSANPTFTHRERDVIKQFLYATGTLFVTASGEADNLLALLSKQGVLDAVVSTDMDFLARGVQNMLVPEISFRGDILLHLYHKPTVLRELGFTDEQFLDFCLLLGSDYTPNVRSFTYRAVFHRIKIIGSLQDVCDRIGLTTNDYEQLLRAKAMLRGDDDDLLVLLRDSQAAKLAAGPPKPEPEWLDLAIQEGVIPIEARMLLLAA